MADGPSRPRLYRPDANMNAPDAVLVCCRRKNFGNYQALLDKRFPHVPQFLVSEAVRMLYDIRDDREVSQAILATDSQILAVMDAPVEVFEDYPPLDTLVRLSRITHANLKQALIVDTEWSHVKVPRPRGWQKGDQIHFNWPPQFDYDPEGPEKLIHQVTSALPQVDILRTTDNGHKTAIDRYFQHYDRSRAQLPRLDTAVAAKQNV